MTGPQTAVPKAQALLDEVMDTIATYAYSYDSEATLHAGIASVLEKAGFIFEREVVASQHRFDFLVVGPSDEQIVIEVKVKGSYSQALRQVQGYAARSDVSAVLLITTCRWGPGVFPSTLHDKPTRIIQLVRAL